METNNFNISFALILFFALRIFAQNSDTVSIDSLLKESKLQGNRYRISISVAEEAFQKAKQANYLPGQAEALALIADGWRGLQDYPKNLDFLLQELDLRIQLKDQLKIANVYIKLAEYYRAIYDYPTGLSYGYKALRIFEAAKDDYGVAKVCDRLSAIYYEIQAANYSKRDSCRYFANRSISLSRKFTDYKLIISTLNILCGIDSGNGNSAAALKYQQEAIDLALKYNILTDLPLLKINLGWVYFHQKNYPLALKITLEGYTQAKSDSNYVYSFLSSYLLSQIYSAMNDYKSACFYLTEYFSSWFIISGPNKLKQAADIIVKKDKEIEQADLASEKKIGQLRIAIIAGALIAVLIISGFIFYRNKSIKKLNDELNIKNQLISEQNLKLSNLIMTKDRLISIIAHDLKNPYQSLIGFSNILIEDFSELSEKEIKEYLGYIFEAADSGQKLLQNILDWSHSESGKISINLEHLDLEDVIKDAVELVSGNIRQKEIKIHLDKVNGTKIFCDRNMLYTILRNLLANAIKFSYRGGTISINAVLNDNFVNICIIDYGMGMSKSVIDEIFEIDKKGTKEGTEKEKGTGIGLVLVKDFIEKINGKIEVRSEPGKGSTFIISIPKGE